MQDFTSVDQLRHATLFGHDGDRIGTIGQVYLDDHSNQPTFVTVQTGLFGLKETFIPVSQATPVQGGLQVPFDKAFIKDAPTIDADGALSPDAERRLYEYYSMDYPDTGTGTGSGDRTRDAAPGTAGRDRGHDRGHDRESVVARDEQLHVGTERRESGQVRLRKHTYTDIETVEVPVTREEVVVEREPIHPSSPEAQRGGGDEEVTVTTHDEVPVVAKTATAEKVTVDTNTVRDTERVSGTVQHESVQVDTADAADTADPATGRARRH